MNGGRFAPCPATPNCVSSRDRGTGHYIDPLHYDGDKVAARAALLNVLAGFKRAQVVDNEDDYISAVFKSMIFRFADVVEFQFDADEKRIHMKSASRVGYSDLGVNRRRCEAIRAEFNRLLDLK